MVTLYNALKQGDVIKVAYKDSLVVVSQIEYDKYTNGKNGYVMPDIPIPNQVQEYKKTETLYWKNAQNFIHNQ